MNLPVVHFQGQYRVWCCQLFTRMSAWAVNW